VRARLLKGDVGLALFFAGLGLVWLVGSFGYPFWEGFAPQSGFLPFFYGLLLAGLGLAILAGAFLETNELASDAEPVGKPLVILGALTAAAIGVEAAGFGVAVFLLLLFLFAGVERLPVLRSLLVAGATTAALILIFRTWLGVPFPAGPLGF
jgi:putative tricarboxylic transport membrane protein